MIRTSLLRRQIIFARTFASENFSAHNGPADWHTTQPQELIEMAKTRMYVVDVRGDENLVEAVNPSQALKAVTQAGVSCRAASSKDVARLLGAGKPLIDATATPAEPEPADAAATSPAL